MVSTIRDRPILQLVHHSAAAASALIFIADEQHARQTTGANQNLSESASTHCMGTARDGEAGDSCPRALALTPARLPSRKNFDGDKVLSDSHTHAKV